MNLQEIKNAKYDDLVFQNRNKTYGAYILRKSFNNNMIFATIITNLVFAAIILAFFIPTLLKGDEITEPIVTNCPMGEVPDIVTVNLINNTGENENAPNKQEEMAPTKPKITHVPPKVTADDDVNHEAQTHETKELFDHEGIISGTDDTGDPNSSNNTDEGGNGTGTESTNTTPKKPTPKTPKEPKPYEFIHGLQKQPTAINLSEISKNIGYPPTAKAAGIQGNVVFRVLVSPEGKYVKHIITKKAHALLVNPCLNEVKKLQFSPAIQAGKPVACWVNIPFSFKLKQ